MKCLSPSTGGEVKLAYLPTLRWMSSLPMKTVLKVWRRIVDIHLFPLFLIWLILWSSLKWKWKLWYVWSWFCSCHAQRSSRLKMMYDPTESCFHPMNHFPGVKSMSLSASPCCMHFLTFRWWSSPLYSASYFVKSILWRGLQPSRLFWRQMSVNPCHCSPLGISTFVCVVSHSSWSSCWSPFGSWIAVLGIIVKSSSEILEESTRCSGTHIITRRHVWTRRRMPRSL